MKIATFDLAATRTNLSREMPANPILAAFRDFIDGIRQARAEHSMRVDLATLDDSVLRDIGIATDEIPRVLAREQFTPRAWQ